MIVMLDALTTEDDSTKFHDCQSEEELPPDPTRHMLELFSLPGLNMGQPMKFQGSINSLLITVLIDS